MTNQNLNSDELVQKLGDVFPELTIERDLSGIPTLVAPREQYVAIVKKLREDPTLQFVILSDLKGMQFPQDDEPFEVVVHLTSMQLAARVAVKVRATGDPPTVPSLAAFWHAANWHEREAYDMFGIEFEGHPDPRRIFLEEDADFYPLRKEFPTEGYEE